MLHSFRSRILALVLGLVTVMLCATLIAVMLRTRAEVKQQAARQLRSAADTAREMLRFRGDQLSSAAEVLTSDFGFKEAVASADTATLYSSIFDRLLELGLVDVNDLVILTKGELSGVSGGTNSMQILRVTKR